MSGRTIPERIPRTPILFGTDGWRAVIAHEFTFANLERVAQAYADYLNQTHQTAQAKRADEATDAPHAVVGYDRRFLSDKFAARAAEVLAGNGIRVRMFDQDVPTPLVSWAVRERGAAGGVVITASHNPAEFNGFKIKAPWGGSATRETTAAVEALVDAQPPRRTDLTEAMRGGLDGAVESYRAQIKSYVDLEMLKGKRARVVVDPMHGSGGRWVESFLKGGALDVETIRAERDTQFGGVNPEPIERNLAPLRERVREMGALVGLATDGDADRVGAVNELGETMTMHEVVPLLLLHLARRRGMTGGVVRTFSQSVLTKRIAAAHNLKLYETPIGFKYVADLMLREDILVGAEESGGVGVKGHIPERDGILNSLLFLEAVVAAGKSPSEMVREMHREFGEFYFGRRDLHLEVARGLNLVETLSVSPPEQVAGHTVHGFSHMDGMKLIFGDESWLLFRQSGTEPVLRIYSEATSVAKVNELLDAGCAMADKAEVRG
ncbi:MAG TPA: phosphoglucomutase/phosphomannomutase family protein [Pyrinomonadaceae bacterium]|nr:phosphoglucomutase/phosphomannomutase family protein [Pyrinomonadaceae bacterium]